MPLFPEFPDLTNLSNLGKDGLGSTGAAPKAESAFSINGFVSRVGAAGGLAKTNRFKVLFGDSTVDFWCQQAELPGKALMTSDSRIYGAIYKTPTESQYQEVNLSFLCDLHMTQKVYFDNWMDQINRATDDTGSRYFDFGYRDDYVKDIIIQQLSERDAEVTYEVSLYNAFPTNISHLQTNWQDDHFHILNVTLAYDYWLAGEKAPVNKMTIFPAKKPIIPKLGNLIDNPSSFEKPSLLDRINNTVNTINKGIDQAEKKASSAISKVAGPINKVAKTVQNVQNTANKATRAVNSVVGKATAPINKLSSSVGGAKRSIGGITKVPNSIKNAIGGVKGGIKRI